jgi:hypothetical protein
VICAIGDFSLQNLLDKMSRNRTVAAPTGDDEGRAEGKRMEQLSDPGDQPPGEETLRKNHRRTQGASVLTRGETPDFVAAGGMLTMLLGSGTNVQFEVNLDATDKARLKISARLLSLARRVVQTKAAEAKSYHVAEPAPRLLQKLRGRV